MEGQKTHDGINGVPEWSFVFFSNNTVIQIITIAMYVTGQGLSEIAKLRWTTFRNIIVTRRKEERERDVKELDTKDG